MECRGCGQKISEFGGNHHCDPKVENRINARRNESDEAVKPEPNWNKRLSTGFAMMRGISVSLR